MRAIMKSVSPRICEKVANGDCTILVSKTAPKFDLPFKGYICCTNAKPYLYREANPPFKLFLDSDLYEGNGYDDRLFSGKVIGDFICDEIIEWQYDSGHQYYVDYPDDCTSYFPYLKCHSEATGLKCSEIENYGKGKPLYGWHISDLKIYDKPKQISDFLKPCPDPYQYCTICKHCVKIIPPDEEEYALYHGGHYDYCEEHCMNILRNPPKGWCYVEEL